MSAGELTDGSHRSVVASAFDERAATYDQSALHSDLALAVANFVSIHGVRSVLDIGTGTGLVLRALADHEDFRRLVGVDISRQMLTVASKALSSALWTRASAEQIPLRDHSIDLVTCVTVMHLVPDPDTVFSEVARVLRREGSAVIATFESAPDLSTNNRPYATNHSAFATVERIAKIARSAGLAVRRH